MIFNNPTYQILLKSFFNNISQREINNLNLESLLQETQKLLITSSVREDCIIMSGYSILLLKKTKLLKQELRDQYQGLFRNDRVNADDTKKKQRNYEGTRTTKKRIVAAPFLLCIDPEISSSEMEIGLRNLGSNQELSLSSVDVPRYQQNVELVSLIDHRFQTPRSFYHQPEQNAEMELDQIQEKLRQRKIRFLVLPPSYQELRQNFTNLMAYSFVENLVAVDDQKTKKRYQQKVHVQAFHAVTVDKQTVLDHSMIKESESFELSSNSCNQMGLNKTFQPSQQNHEEDSFIKQSILSKIKRKIKFEDSLDKILFEVGNLEEALPEETNKLIEHSSQIPSFLGSANSYTQFQQIGDDFQIVRDESDEMSVQSDHLQLSHMIKRSDVRRINSNFKAPSVLDEILPHQLQTIRETVSQTQIDSRSKINISMKLHDKCGVEKAAAFYDLLLKVYKDRRYTLQQDEPQTFGDIQCLFQ